MTYPRLEHAITLVRPRVFVVQVAGLVKNPDGHRVTALTRVSRVIALAGGRASGGSQTRIEVRRQGKVIVANLLPFYLFGDRAQNPRLLEGDVVYVPPIAKEASVSGAVNRPGSYELQDGQTLGDLIDRPAACRARRARSRGCRSRGAWAATGSRRASSRRRPTARCARCR